MNKFILFSIITAFFFLGNGQNIESKPIKFENQFSTISKNSSLAETSQEGRKRKDGRYKRKKGFMWGLFRGKKECDCPKH
ncbi:MAG: hypothetical protein V4683_19620 [Bacteroidota bacterium]